jgi:hypothetical protein
MSLSTRPPRKAAGVRGRLRAHDPFELIRWLALSQTDPRKALAELVQNCLDARADHVRITRFRTRGVSCLKIVDDGEGVIPELGRVEALQYIATHVGHSRKRKLSPQERLQLMTQGQYGIGLLGFWSLGEMLEMRSVVPGQRPERLVLYRDKPTYRIEPVPGRLALDERRTEILVSGVHADAQRLLTGPRTAEYLGSELRGQLLERSVSIVIEDRLARKRSHRSIPVRPRRFLGEPLEGLDRVEVPGWPDARLEVYWNGDGAGDSEGIGLYGAGTQVAEGFRALASLGLDRPPWTDARLTGLVDFPSFRIAPGSRRGVIIDPAAEAFARAMESVEPILIDALATLEERRSADLEKTMLRDLQRVFRDFYRHRPRYSLLPVAKEKDVGVAGDGDGAAGGSLASPEEHESETETNEKQLDLLPPGPLASVRIRPSTLQLAPAESRALKASGCDAAGRIVEEPVTFEWTLSSDIGRLRSETEEPRDTDTATGERVTFEARYAPGDGSIHVTATAPSGAAIAEVPVTITDELPGRGDEGIPDPELVDAPGERWRSRLLEERWQVNSGHGDFRAVGENPTLKLRYLAMLFAKEVVVHDHRDPRLEGPLEQLVEVAAYADRQLVAKRKRGRRAGSDGDTKEVP